MMDFLYTSCPMAISAQNQFSFLWNFISKLFSWHDDPWHYTGTLYTVIFLGRWINDFIFKKKLSRGELDSEKSRQVVAAAAAFFLSVCEHHATTVTALCLVTKRYQNGCCWFQRNRPISLSFPTNEHKLMPTFQRTNREHENWLLVAPLIRLIV